MCARAAVCRRPTDSTMPIAAQLISRVGRAAAQPGRDRHLLLQVHRSDAQARLRIA